VTELFRAIISSIVSMWKTAAMGVTTLFTPSRWATIPRKLAQISLPAIVAIIVFLFLTALAVAWGLYLRSRPDFYPPAWSRSISLLVVLIILITIITYYTVKVWIEGEGSPFEDIDRAWQDGIDALERNHFDLRQIPLFVFLGSEGPEQNRVLMGASRLSLTVDNVPPGPAALHWYANQDGVYLFCTQVGVISKLAQLASQGGPSPVSGPAPSDLNVFAGTLTADQVQAVMKGGQRSSADGEEEGDGGGPPPASTPDIRGTMMPIATLDPRDTITPATVKRAISRSVDLKRDEVELQRNRLAYLCKLIERNRRPLCGVNGVMTVLPIKMIASDSEKGAWVQEAVRSDLAGMTAGLKLRFPVIALVTGMEEEKGFDELIRRVGRQRAQEQRFGKGFGVWDPPLDEEILALCKHACGAFEDWSYHLFKEPNSLSKPGNRALYMLLCKVRRILQPRLENILVGGYSDTQKQQDATPILFAGCYFSGTGDIAERQAFVKGVFDLLPQWQEELDWTDAALAEENRYRIWSSVAFTTAALFLIGIGVVGYQLYKK
jgi:hypothetical protein